MSAEKGEHVYRMGAWSPGPGCHGGCGLEFHVKDGRVIKVEGDPEHPWYHGRVCARALALTQYIYHPDRLRHPLKRVGERGEGMWCEISWDEAFDLCEKRLTEIADKWGPESVIFSQGTGRDIGGPITMLAYAYGSPNWTMWGLSGHACFTPRLAAGYVVQGDFTFPDYAQFLPERYESPEYVPPKCIMFWGRSMGRGCADHYTADHWLIDVMRRGAKVIVVDPRETWIATRADLFLKIRPGTDNALALALLNVMVTENLVDEAFIDDWCLGYDEMAGRSQEFTPEWAEPITWIPAAKIREAARMYAANRPAGIEVGRPVEGAAEGTQATMNIHRLIAISGNLDVPGGNVICRPAYCVSTYPFSTEEVVRLYGPELHARLSQKRVGADKYPLVKNFRAWAQEDVLIEQMETGDPYEIHGLWMQGTNPLANQAQDVKRHYRAALKLDFNVVVDLFMTPTAQLIADLVLPAATIAEKDSIYCIGAPLNSIHKLVDVPDCKSDWEISFALAKRLNPQAVPWGSVREMLTDRMKASGYTFEELIDKVWDLAPKGHKCGSHPYRRYVTGSLRSDAQPGFRTPTGKVELYCTSYEAWGYDPLPYFKELGPQTEERTPEVFKDYPLVMMTGRRSPVLFHSEHRQIPWLRECDPDPLVEISPQTASEKGIKNGDWVLIEGTMGQFKRRAKVTSMIDPRTIMVPHAWWLPEDKDGGSNPYKVWDLNCNQLIPMGYNDSSGFGGGPLSYMLVRVSRTNE